MAVFSKVNAAEHLIGHIKRGIEVGKLTSRAWCACTRHCAQRAVQNNQSALRGEKHTCRMNARLQFKFLQSKWNACLKNLAFPVSSRDCFPVPCHHHSWRAVVHGAAIHLVSGIKVITKRKWYCGRDIIISRLNLYKITYSDSIVKCYLLV